MIKKVSFFTILSFYAYCFAVPCSLSAFNFLDAHYQYEKDYELLPQEAASELCLDDTVTIINRTITPVGTWALKNITYPSKNIDAIIARQAVVKELFNQTTITQELEVSLHAIKDSVQAILTYFDDNNPLTKEAKKMYFNFAPEKAHGILLYVKRFNDYLNSNPIALECGPFIGIGMVAMQYIIQRMASNIGTEFVRRAKQKTLPNPPQEKSFLHCIFNGIEKTFSAPIIMHMPNFYQFREHITNSIDDKLFREIETNTYGSSLSIKDRALYYRSDCSIPNNLSYVCASGYTAIFDVLVGYLIYHQVKNFNETTGIINKLRARLAQIAHIIKNAEIIYKTCTKTTCLRTLTAVKTLGDFLQNPSKKVTEIIKLLHTDTFNGENSIFYRRGRVLLAHYLLTELKHEFLPLLYAIGEIDAHVGIARLMYEHVHTNQHYCFTHFASCDEHPRIVLTNFWLPLITNRAPVLNSLILGAHNTENILLAGPNGCGKSTFMKAIAYNWVILPLSWGISAADHAVVTPLTHIKTSINIQENVHEGQSTYMAQKKRFDSIYTMVETHRNDTRALFLIDEPLSGTVEAEAADQTIELGKAIAKNPSVCAVIATHLELPTHLDTITNRFTNYCPEVIELENGVFTQTFRLIPGRTDWWFNDRAKRSRFLLWLSNLIAK